MANAEAGRAIIRLSYVLAAIAALAVAAVGALYERQGGIVHRQEERGDAFSAVSVVRSQLQGALDSDLQLAQGLVGIIEYEPAMTPEEFGRLAARMLRGREGIRTLAAAPDLVVSMVYPPGAEGAPRPQPSRHPGRPPGDADGACARHDGAERADRARRRRTRLHRPHPGLRRRREPVAAILGARQHGDRAGCPLSQRRPARRRPSRGPGGRRAGRRGLAAASSSSATRPCSTATRCGPRWRFRSDTGRWRRCRRAAGRRPTSGRSVCSFSSPGCSSSCRSSRPDGSSPRGRYASPRSACARPSSRGCPGGWSSPSRPRASASGTSTSPPTSCSGTSARASSSASPSARATSASRTGSGRSIPTTAPARSPRRARRRVGQRQVRLPLPDRPAGRRDPLDPRRRRALYRRRRRRAAWSASSGTSPPTSSGRRSSTCAAARRKRRPTRSRASSRR